MSPYNVLLGVVCCCFHCLHTFKQDIVRGVTEFHCSTKFNVFNAAVSEIRELNQNKEEKNNSEIDYI